MEYCSYRNASECQGSVTSSRSIDTEAFIHPPEPCEACFIMDTQALFYFFWTFEKKKNTHPLPL